MCGVWGFFTYQLLYWRWPGEKWAALLAIFTGLMLFSFAMKLLSAYWRFVAARRQFKMFKAAGAALGGDSARLATRVEVEEAGLLAPDGLFLGEFFDERGGRHELRYDGENAVLLLGPPSAHKTTSVLINSLLPAKSRLKLRGRLLTRTLLRLLKRVTPARWLLCLKRWLPENRRPFRSGGSMGHSVVVNDPNGEAYAICQQALRDAGFRIRCICPFHKELSAKLGVKICDDGLDLWSDFSLDTVDAFARSLIVDKAAAMLPPDRQEDSRDKFFKDGGRKLFMFLALFLIAHKIVPTPSLMREMILEGVAGILERCRAAMDMTDKLGGSLAQLAKSIHGYGSAGDQFAGYLGSCERGLSLFDEGIFGDHFKPGAFDPRTLKDDTPTVVFVMYPTQKAASHQLAVNLTFTHILECLASDPRLAKRCTLLIDETAGLGYLPNLMKSINEYRKFGIRCVLFFQEMAGQAERIYGSYTVKELLAACEVIWASNVREPSALEMLSKKCGEILIDDRSMTGRNSDNPFGQNSRSHKTRPFMRPDEIRRMDREDALVIYGNLNPILVRKAQYWKRPVAEVAGENPYRQGS